MNRTKWIATLSVACSGVMLLVATGQDVPPPVKQDVQPPAKLDPKLPEGMQIENRGPVHEAFANPGDPVRGKADGNVAPKAPPPRVPELPPEEKPAGDNVAWIPGYWQFDGEKKDFIWVSGFWRNAPPGRSWSAGEWRVENGQNRYIPGYWKQTGENNWRVDLPEPPKSVESGPNIPAPHQDAIWIPGHWMHRNDSYAWRPGYWGEVENNMMWMPSQYVYTGSGYRYVTGYWDHCFEDRGLLYAPVYFTRPLWLTPGWAYRPYYGINIGFGGGWAWGYGGFYDNLYLGVGYGGFWFGNYGGWGYWGAGYRPWCWGGFHNSAYHHYAWLNRNNPNWNVRQQQSYAARSLGVLPGASRSVATANSVTATRNLSPNTLHSATSLVSKVGGDKAGQQFADRVQKGQTIQSANQALRQSGSQSLVQPASQVQRNLNVARTLPASTTSSQNVVKSLSTSKPTLAANNETVLRNQINSAIRNAPTGSFNRTSSGSFTSNLPNGSRSVANDQSSFRSSGSSSVGRSFDSSSGRSFSSGSSSIPSSGRSFSGSSGGGSSGGSRGGFTGGGGGSSGGGGGSRGSSGGKR